MEVDHLQRSTSTVRRRKAKSGPIVEARLKRLEALLKLHPPPENSSSNVGLGIDSNLQDSARTPASEQLALRNARRRGSNVRHTPQEPSSTATSQSGLDSGTLLLSMVALGASWPSTSQLSSADEQSRPALEGGLSMMGLGGHGGWEPASNQAFLASSEKHHSPPFITRPLSIFHDLPPLPSQDLLNTLVTLHFSHIPIHLSFIHRASFLSNPLRDPVLLFSIVTLSSTLTDSPELRQVGRQELFPRMHRLIEQATHNPSVASLGATVYAFFYAMHDDGWERARWYFSQCIAQVYSLGLNSEDAFRSLMLDSWIEQESGRRTFWAVYNLDKMIGTALGSSFAFSGRSSWNLRLPCPDSVWLAVGDPPTRLITSPTLEEFFGVSGIPGWLELDHSSTSTFMFECTAMYLQGRVVEVHRIMARQQLPTMTIGVSMAPQGDLNDVAAELRIWEARINEYLARKRAVVNFPNIVKLQCLFHTIWTILHTSAEMTEFTSRCLLRPRWVNNVTSGFDDACRKVQEAMHEHKGTLELWLMSPLFTEAFTHASTILGLSGLFKTEFDTGPLAYHEDAVTDFVLGAIPTVFLVIGSVHLFLHADSVAVADASALDLLRYSQMAFPKVRGDENSEAS
ncbi:hypothetical protein M427DRAFT_155328 [Gonapodya prolifera JEL478]|uniref:Xylanolytic transcriptional activator regulatory domain-containing protein n=1 Tax=Gonapodya prolifera (strain JEL478) TaxID=1344416 RepID=A0A139AEV4_GONPJ|nr:hypothetical protein M427DRAFT_155328 [Gonapodya prolifera JEL478]|eukprot:KXS15352.1 hypothetical protein M427DRAFT_155328 [Gonapodya prolifera JEL478]